VNLASMAFRALDGCSIAAARTLLSRGPSAAREVIARTRAAASRDEGHIHRMDPWNLVRAFPAERPLAIGGSDWIDGCTAPLERFILAQLVGHFQPKSILEVGTYRGATTRILLDNSPAGSNIYTIDLPLGSNFAELGAAATDERLILSRQVGINFAGHPRSGDVTQILGSSFEEATWEQIPNGIDFAFVDASHSYDAVKNDSERVFGKLRPDGVVLWHDYTGNESTERGVGRYIRELMRCRDDIFVCSETELAIRVPATILAAAGHRVAGFFPAGDFHQRFPAGVAPWLPPDRHS
jgi:predicted O-methyltransferase YrrM